MINRTISQMHDLNDLARLMDCPPDDLGDYANESIRILLANYDHLVQLPPPTSHQTPFPGSSDVSSDTDLWWRSQGWEYQPPFDWEGLLGD